MLRGAIDYTSPQRIGGWIYSEVGSVTGRSIMAFLDGECVGSGWVEHHRQDLADALLGDGNLGFNFAISVPSEEDVSRVVVKLDGSDLVLLQTTSRIAPSGAAGNYDNFLLRFPHRIEWMRKRGWLEQSEFDFLKFFSQFGAYDLSLRQTKAAEQAGKGRLMDPAEVACGMMGLLHMRDVEVGHQEITEVAELSELRSMPYVAASVVALWSSRVDTVLIIEGSHNASPSQQTDSLEGAIEYHCGADRLMFLNLKCRIGMHPGRVLRNLRVFYVKN